MGNKEINKFVVITLIYLLVISLYIYLDNLVWLRDHYYPEYTHKVYRKFYKNDKFSIFRNNKNTIYSYKQFYAVFPKFNYYIYRNSKLDFFKNKTELDVISYWYNNDRSYDFLNIEGFDNTNLKNVIIHTHPFAYNVGGVVVEYYLGSLLDRLGIKVRMYEGNKIKNHIYDNYYDNDFDINDCIVIYGETILGNPLNSSYNVRWILGELGISGDKDAYQTWGKNDLVYYFNSELKFNTFPEKVGTIYKLLTTVYLNPSIKNYNSTDRDGYCYTMRKSHIHKNINVIHTLDSFEIIRDHTQDDYIKIFNKYKYFISYDPLTFMCIIAPLCGCISIVYPIEGVSKKEWLQMGGLSEYFKSINNYNLYGVAYGNSPEELKNAEETIHLVNYQWSDFKTYQSNLIKNFINDINNFGNMKNTVQNNYF
jgi:hypothetical protein